MIQTSFSKREEPLNHCLQLQLFGLLKKLLSKFVKPSLIVARINNVDGLYSLQYNDPVNLVHDENLVRIYHKAKTEEAVE